MDPYKLRLVSRGKGYKEAMLPHLPKLWLWAPLTVELVLAADDDTPAVIASITEVALSIHTLDGDRIPLDDPMLIYKTSTVLTNTDKSKGPHASITLSQGDIMNITEAGDYWIAIHVTAGGERYVRAAGYITLVDDGFPVAPGEPTAPGNPYLTEGAANGLYLTLDQTPEQTGLTGHKAEICAALGAAQLSGAAFTGAVSVGGKTVATTDNTNGLPSNMALYGKWDQTGAVTKGTPCYIYGANGSNKLLRKADAATEGTSSKTIGLLLQDIADTGAKFGYVITEGDLLGITVPGGITGIAEGVSVWLGAGGGFAFALPPAKPNHSVFLGVVTRFNGSTFDMYVKVQNGYELDELHNVLISSSVGSGEALFYDSVEHRWVNRAVTVEDLGSDGVGTKFLSGDGTWKTVTGGTGATTLDGLDDVVIGASGTALTSSVLSHNGTDWVNTKTLGTEEYSLTSVTTVTLNAGTVDATNVNATLLNVNPTATGPVVMWAQFGVLGTSGNLSLGGASVAAFLGGYSGTIYFGQNAYWDQTLSSGTGAWVRRTSSAATYGVFWMQSGGFYWSNKASSTAVPDVGPDTRMHLATSGNLYVRGDIYAGASSLPSVSGAKVATETWVGTQNFATLGGTQTLTNKTIGTGCKITLTVADSTGDLYCRETDGTLKRIPLGSSGQVLSVVGESSYPSWATPTGGSGSITLEGDVTGSSTTGTITTTIGANKVDFAKMQQIYPGTLLGRGTSDIGNVESISVGTGLGIASGSLSLSDTLSFTYSSVKFPTISVNTKGQVTAVTEKTASESVTALTTIITTSSTSIILDNGYSGKILVCTSGSAVSISVGVGLTSPFSIMVIQAGAGQVTFVASSTIINRYGGTSLAIAGQHGAASLVCTAVDTFNLSGALA